MLYTFLDNKNKTIYFLKSPSAKANIGLFIAPLSFFFFFFLVIVLLFYMSTIINSRLGGGYTSQFILAIGVITIFLYIVIIRINHRLTVAYVIKYMNCQGYIERIGSEELKITRLINGSPSNEIKKLLSSSYLRSRKLDGGCSIEIVINDKEVIDIAKYFSDDIISTNRMGINTNKYTMTYRSVDKLINMTLNIPLKKEYSESLEEN